MKTLKTVWVYGWAYLFIARELLNRFGDWMLEQIDHNDFLSGFMFAWILFCLAWLGGVVTLEN
ncbi:MAG: hypothetical protein IJ216_02330 [Acidaminococcaceae bacterium]|nr:hypothetical protein [Acidaminococcaceae bacterium]